MTDPHPKPVTHDDSPYVNPGVAVWAPRLKMVTHIVEPNGGVCVEFVPADGKHPWAVPDDEPAFELSAIVHEIVQLEEGKEYFAYFVPVEMMNHDQ